MREKDGRTPDGVFLTRQLQDSFSSLTVVALIKQNKQKQHTSFPIISNSEMPIELNQREYNNGRNASVFELAAPGLLGGYGYDGYATHATSSIKADARTPSLYQHQAQNNHAVCSPSSVSEKDQFEEDGMSTPMAIRPTVAAAAAAVATVSPGPGDDTNIPTKPMRPLTSYHMYFQLEREFPAMMLTSL
jgi:hypothetical protein